MIPHLRFGIRLSEIKSDMALAYWTPRQHQPESFYLVKEAPPATLPQTGVWSPMVQTFLKQKGCNLYFPQGEPHPETFEFDDKGSNPRLNSVTPVDCDSSFDVFHEF